jgi:hypothetical protein
MRIVLAIAFGMLLLMSAAAAIGNSNTITATMNEEATGMSITGANFAQIEEADANLMGNNILATQDLSLMAADNQITGDLNNNGLPDGKTNFFQTIDMEIKDTGNNNVDEQQMGIGASGNILTVGNVTQIAMEKIDDSGNDNHVTQDPDVLAGSSDPTCLTRSDFQQAVSLNAYVKGNANDVDQFVSFYESDDSLTDSKFRQQSILNAYVDGNGNKVDQGTIQNAFDNKLISSELVELAIINANILGNDNNLGIGASQRAIQNAGDNDLVCSLAKELICLDEQTKGNNNNAISVVDTIQFAETDLINNCMTASTAFQSIDAKVKEIGSDNNVEQHITLTGMDNKAVDGKILQQTDIETNL